MNRKRHREKWEACELCTELGGCAATIVKLHPFHDGLNAQRVLFLGEAPGRTEELMGKPFVGQSGQLLRQIIKHVKRKLRRYPFFPYLQNVVCCRPPDNRDPMRKEIHNCQPRLIEAISLIDPHVVVTVGGVAKNAWSVMQTKPKKINTASVARRHIDKLHSVLERPTLHVLHPASILRSPDSRQEFIIEEVKVDLVSYLEKLWSQ